MKWCLLPILPFEFLLETLSRLHMTWFLFPAFTTKCRWVQRSVHIWTNLHRAQVLLIARQHQILSVFFSSHPPKHSYPCTVLLPRVSWCQRWGHCQLHGVPTQPAVIATKPEARCNLSILHHLVLPSIIGTDFFLSVCPFFFFALSKQKQKRTQVAL